MTKVTKKKTVRKKKVSKKSTSSLPSPEVENQETPETETTTESETETPETPSAPEVDMESEYEALLESISNFKPGQGYSKSAECFRFADKFNLTYKGNCLKTGRPLFAEIK